MARKFKHSILHFRAENRLLGFGANIQNGEKCQFFKQCANCDGDYRESIKRFARIMVHWIKYL